MFILRVCLIYIIVFLCNIILSIDNVEAQMLDIFTNCNIGSNNGINSNNLDNNSTVTTTTESDQGYITSMNVPIKLEKICRSNCGILVANEEESNININNDLVLECQNICRQNKAYTYSPYKRLALSQSSTSNQNDPETNTNYTVQNRYSIIKLYGQTSLKFTNINTPEQYFYTNLDKNNITNIKLDSNYDNTIYACGHKIIRLEPTFPNMFTMSYSNVFGGNAAELSTKEIIDKNNPITTQILLANNKYAGVYDFNYDDCNSQYKKKHKDKSLDDDDLETIGQKLINNNLKDCSNIPDASIYQDLQNRKITSNSESYGYKSWWATSRNDSDWDATSKTYHPCFSGNTNPVYNSDLINGNYITNPNTEQLDDIFDLINHPESVGCYPTWNIYNRDYIDTGITLSDKDYLSISWSGNIIVGNGLTVPFIDLSRAKMLASGDQWIFRNFSQSKFTKMNFLNPMSSLDFDGMDILVGEAGALAQKNDPNDQSQICSGTSLYDRLGTDEQRWYGLSGAIDRQSGIAPTDMDEKNSDQYVTFQCQNTFLNPDRYSFSGILSGVGNAQPLKIRHYIPSDGLEAELYKNSILNGGYQVTIEWKGCPMEDGEGLEYAFGDNNSTTLSSWQPVDIQKLQNGGLNFVPQSLVDQQVANDTTFNTNVIFDGTKNTKVFFRVNTAVRDTNIPPDGSYTLKINNTTIQNNGYVPWYDITKQIALTVFTVLIGDPASVNTSIVNIAPNGAGPKMFNVLCQAMRPLIQLVLVLYIMILGLGFIMGTSKMNQQEFIKIMFKISLVFLIFSDSGRMWFINAYIKVFVIGVMHLIYQIQNFVYEIMNSYSGTNVNRSPNDVFDIFSIWKMWQYFATEAFGQRLVALMVSSTGGFVLAAAILLSVLLCIIGIYQAMFFYLSAIITQSMLLLLSPFFFLSNLFRNTENMFQQWTKQVTTFALSPIASAMTITLFLLLIDVGLAATMGFSYCLGCRFKIASLCIDAYYTLDLMFTPLSSSTPIGLFAGVLTFLVIGYLAMSGSKFGDMIISRMITFNPAFGSGSMGGIVANALMSTVQSIGKQGGGVIQGVKEGRRKYKNDAMNRDFKKFDKDFKALNNPGGNGRGNNGAAPVNPPGGNDNPPV